jgi:hypothetical protein
MPFADHYDMVQAFPSNRTNHLTEKCMVARGYSKVPAQP